MENHIKSLALMEKKQSHRKTKVGIQNKNAIFCTKIHPFIEKVTRTLILAHDTNNVLCTTVWTKIFFLA